MSELIERYLHQVGQYLPPKERKEIEAELRSQIEDQLEDRFADAPTQAEIASVLEEMGHPYKIAISYRSEQYLIGPELYPMMIEALRYGWIVIPTVVLFLSVFLQLTSTDALETLNFTSLVIEPLFNAIYATFIFSCLIVFIFAIIQRGGNFDKKAGVFNPLELPKVDDPTAVDRFETAFGIAFSTVVTLLLLYWHRMGGLTLHFSLNHHAGDVIPVSTFWITFLIGIVIGIAIVNLAALRCNHWSVGKWLLETVLMTIGVLGMYFVLYKPIFAHILATHPTLAEVPLLASAPEIIAILTAILTLTTKSTRLIKLWNHTDSA